MTIKRYLKRALRRFVNTVRYLYEYPRFRASCRRARQASEMRNRTKFYCIKLHGRYYEFCRDDINAFKRQGIFRKDLTFLDLQKFACYQTK